LNFMFEGYSLRWNKFCRGTYVLKIFERRTNIYIFCCRFPRLLVSVRGFNVTFASQSHAFTLTLRIGTCCCGPLRFFLPLLLKISKWSFLQLFSLL
jgi:hypothetical protein